MATIHIEPRFCGPATSGNGGYSCGLVAAFFPREPVEVTLRSPPPLGRPLDVAVAPDLVRVTDGATLVAEGKPAALDLGVLPAPDFETARRMAAHYPGLRRHFFPHCFVCGTDRADGLRIFPGRETEGGPAAAPWIPDPSLCDDAGVVKREHLWAALDCAGYWGAAPADTPPALLGRMTAEVDPAIEAGDRCVVMGWSLGSEGRKLHAATAIFDGAGRLRGRARQVWIRI